VTFNYKTHVYVVGMIAACLFSSVLKQVTVQHGAISNFLYE